LFLQINLSARIAPAAAPSMFLAPSSSPAEIFYDGSMEEPEHPDIKVWITTKVDISLHGFLFACHVCFYLMQLGSHVFSIASNDTSEKSAKGVSPFSERRGTYLTNHG
jgi:hypothetical protein